MADEQGELCKAKGMMENDLVLSAQVLESLPTSECGKANGKMNGRREVRWTFLCLEDKRNDIHDTGIYIASTS